RFSRDWSSDVCSSDLLDLFKTSTSTIIRPEEIEAMPGMRDIGDVLSLNPDVIDGHFRGGRQGEEYYSLQGMGIMNPLDNSSAFRSEERSVGKEWRSEW